MHSRTRRVRPTSGFGLVALALSTVMLLPAPAASAAPAVDAGATVEYPYTEQADPIAIGDEITISDGSFYDGRYIQFEVENAQGSEVLSLQTDESADTTSGAVSVVGTTVYLGDGSTAQPIGSIDETMDGTAGQPLRVVFASPFANASFEDGTNGWTKITQRVDLGTTSIGGVVTQDTSTYPIEADSADDNVPSSMGTHSVQTSTNGGATDGSQALELALTGVTTLDGYDVVHGPAVISSPFPASEDDEIHFDWRAFSGSDAYHVFGYLLDSAGNQTEVLDTYATSSSNTTWTTKTTTIPADGDYRFVFVAGTFDASGGRAAGAQLYIDNVRVFGSKVTDAAVQQTARKLLYAHDGDDPGTTQTVRVTAVASDATTGSDDLTIAITSVDDPPTMGAIGEVTFENTSGDDAFTDATGALPGTDPDDETLTYSIVGGAADAVTIDGTDYTHAFTGDFGTLRLVETTGEYRFVPNDEAIEAQLVDASHAFTVAVSASGQSDQGTITVAIDITEGVAAAPSGLEASGGNRVASLSWTAPTWIGGQAITGYRIEVSEDGGESWAEAIADTGDTRTSVAVSELENGTEYSFRVSAVNASGPGAASTEVTATPVAPPPAPACDYNESSFSDAMSGWDVPCWTAPTETQPATDVPGWQKEASSFAIANGLVTPDESGAIEPGDTVSRNEAAVAVATLVGAPETDVTNPFVDGDGDTAGALDRLAALGVIEGTGDGRFDGDQPLTRAQVVAILWRLMGEPVTNGGVGFADVVAEWQLGPVAWAHANDIVLGRAEGGFDPDSPLTRGELYVVLHRWVGWLDANAG